jgi:hypothetical protein
MRSAVAMSQWEACAVTIMLRGAPAGTVTGSKYLLEADGSHSLSIVD